MSQLLETIKCKDGKLYNLSFHNSRFNKAVKEQFGISENIDLQNLIEIPENCKKGLFRCRVIYSQVIEKVEFLPHQFRNVKSLKLIENNEIDYHLKFTNREILQQLFDTRGDCDDIRIVKNDCITDSYTANSVFFDGKHWWTPDTSLLHGTQRALLLEKQKIFKCRITPNDLPKYKKAGLINALQNLEEMPIIEIFNIKY